MNGILVVSEHDISGIPGTCEWADDDYELRTNLGELKSIKELHEKYNVTDVGLLFSARPNYNSMHGAVCSHFDNFGGKAGIAVDSTFENGIGVPLGEPDRSDISLPASGSVTSLRSIPGALLLHGWV